MSRLGVSRRGFLNLVGRAGGSAALYQTMAAMGLLPVPAAYAGPPSLPRGLGAGHRVVILGAGIAGLTAALELTRAGFACTILETRDRAGGRSWTLRGGDLIREIDSRQRCGFDAGDELYANMGPARIPQHHQALLGYCRELGVPLQPMVNDNRNAYFQSDKAFGGRPVRAREFIGASRGYIAELLAKAVSGHALDAELTAEDQKSFLAMLRNFGALDREYRFKGTDRLGYSELPGASARPGTPLEPLARAELLKPVFAYFQLNWSEFIDFAPTMMQPVGGMDRIATAFERRLHGMIRYGTEVREIRREGAGVRIVYRDRRSGALRSIAGDTCVCTLPLPVLAGIPADFSPEVRTAIAAPSYAKVVKIAFEANRRFWEEDDQIYGGISWTEKDITQVWYPSSGFHGKKGVLIGAYIWSDDIAGRVGALSPSERLMLAVQNGERLHERYAEHLTHGISVAWHKVPENLGAWADWSAETRKSAYAILCRPDGPFHLAGEHLSYVTGWQEGAVLSAQAAVTAIAERVRARHS
ncbi:MAG TPA: flavin monoamine oxidase family protein [Stellaceae bacterium]|nr:flavin monoamine oxidase family protein [Stellaceae bacterium]